MISMIVAIDQNRGIGKENELLAHIKPDLQYFKKTTEGKVVVMGYNTYESLPIKPLPKRVNVVLTTKNIEIEGVVVLHSIEELLQWAKTQAQHEEIFIIGGASVYEQMMPYAEKLYITHIFHTFDADTFFPAIQEDWEIESVSCKRENIEHHYPHVFTVYSKK